MSSYKEIGKFELSGEELADVLEVGSDGNIKHIPGRYISRLTDKMKGIAAGRYLSDGVRPLDTKISFRFYKQCRNSGCKKKWNVSCNKDKDSFDAGKVEFTFYENRIVCECVQELRPRPLIGKLIKFST